MPRSIRNACVGFCVAVLSAAAAREPFTGERGKPTRLGITLTK